ncbi:hypothetical protein CLOM_g3259 [Closterium sp. NIES-68]|nr:hypothetical protein CLOM_g3259 [Closterium sp. NIES-68]GJP76412.1 hypothetical protein CLOP_g6862 [Closterium sp. NIES-67]
MASSSLSCLQQASACTAARLANLSNSSSCHVSSQRLSLPSLACSSTSASAAGGAVRVSAVKKGGEEGKKKKQRAKVREKGEGAGKWEKEGKKKEILKQQAKLGEEGDRAEKRRKERGDEEGDEGQRSGVEERVKGKCAEEVHSEEGRSEEASPERSWRTVFSSASPADSSPKPSLGLLTDPDPVPNQGSRFGAGPVPDQSGRPGGWCGLCGDGSGWVQCGACDGKGAYATAPGLGGVKGRVGWALCKTCYGWKATPCVLCAVSGAEEWLEWQEHAKRHPVKVQMGREE